jgi:carotenoid cleavage dioxygenase-like enzyme
MDNFLYKCQNCGKEYKPNRRRKQKYCSNSCRTTAFKLRNKKGNLPSKEIETKKPLQVEKISWAGVGNAAAGTLAVNVATSLFTSEENKPATKKDLKEMKELIIKRFHPILNMSPNAFGNHPFYDAETKSVVYLKRSNHGI